MTVNSEPSMSGIYDRILRRFQKHLAGQVRTPKSGYGGIAPTAASGSISGVLPTPLAITVWGPIGCSWNAPMRLDPARPAWRVPSHKE